jgi:hypothetical protein
MIRAGLARLWMKGILAVPGVSLPRGVRLRRLTEVKSQDWYRRH